MPQDGVTPNPKSDIILAGAFAAFMIDVIVYPLDTLKTRFQAKEYAKRYIDPATGHWQRSFFRGLYQGIGGIILATLPSCYIAGVFFLTYESTKSLLAPLPLPASLSNGASSAIAELVSCAILTPAEVIKQNAQMRSSASAPSSAMRTSVTLESMRHFSSRPTALFHGYTALAARNLPFTAMQFPLFEALRQHIIQRRKQSGSWSGSLVETTTVTSIAAGSAGSVAAVVTTPLDVVKTRVMLAAAEHRHNAVKHVRLTEWKAGQQIWQQHGLKGLFRGATLRAVWTMLGSGLYLGLYDMGRVYLARRRGLQLSEDDIM